jgi:rSAM/selenodomain-associated transferase 2
MISIIIPTLNEESALENTLRGILRLHSEALFEIIVVDGGSGDRTVSIASRYGTVVHSAKGKAIQLNTGAMTARGDILFFVHADLWLPEGTIRRVDEWINELGYDGGGFSNVFSSHNQRIKLLGRMLHLEFRNRENDVRNTLFFGDNGIFVRKTVFDLLGGFKLLPIMEDFDFSKRLSDRFQVARILEPKLVASPRRQLKAGFLKTHLQWLVIKRLFLWGVPTPILARWYPDVR